MSRDEDLKLIKDLLQSRKQSILSIKELDDIASWISSNNDSLGSDDVNAAIAENLSAELLDINSALTRIKDGTYGICEDCNKQIPFARLKYIPYTTRCIKCQESLENS